MLKHFPGHGSSRDDSHEGFVDITDTWQDLELNPYRALIGAGLADAVMAAHVFNANLDSEYPASLSKRTITDLLRGDLGFDGVVVSDDLQMGAITEHWDFEEAIRLALLAGTDLLAYGNNLAFDAGLGERVHGTVMRLVERGDVDRAELERSYLRIQALKARLG